jgi:hypothetical protein
MTLRPGGTGDVVADGTFTLPGHEDLACNASATLIGVDENGVLLEDVPGSGENPVLAGIAVCTSGGQYLLRQQPNGDIEFSYSGPDSGNPTGTLRRSA